MRLGAKFYKFWGAYPCTKEAATVPSESCSRLSRVARPRVLVGTSAELLARSSREVAAEFARRVGRAYMGDEPAQIAAWQCELDLVCQALGGNERDGMLIESSTSVAKSASERVSRSTL